MTSSVTEAIRCIAVEDTRIWTTCDHIFNIYDSGKDIAFYMSRDRVNCLFVDHISKDNDFDAVLACQDSCLRILQGSHLFMEIPTANAVTVTACTNGEDNSSRKGSSLITYGMEDGNFGTLQVNSSGHHNFIWQFEEQSKRSPINCMKLFDVTRDGYNEVIIGGDDGRLDIYAGDLGSSMPRLVHTRGLGESIRSVECGLLNSVDCNEVLVASYSGKILSFTSEQVLLRAVEDSYGRNIKTVSNENRLKQLTKELEDLRRRVDRERANVKKLGQSSVNAGAASVGVEFPTNIKFILDKQLAVYVLSIEIQSAMDLVIIRSETVLDVVDSDIGNSVVSITPPSLLEMNPGSEVDTKYKFVAAFRCQGEEHRMSITLRPFEGEVGQLAVTVVTATAPKAAKLVKFSLPPLSLHYRVHDISCEDETQPRHVLRFTGGMSVATVYDWMLSILPDIPSLLPEGISEGVFFFKSAFTGAVSVCRFMRNEVTFESESASTVVIFKESLTKLASARRVQLEEGFNTDDRCIPSYLSLIQSKLEHQVALTRQLQLLDAIREVTVQERDALWLSAEYADIMRNEQAIRKEEQRRAKALEYLTRTVSDLFVSHNKLQGVDARNRLADLQGMLLSSSFDRLVAFFQDASRRHH